METTKRIKVIELLERISNNKDVPEKIGYEGLIYEYRPHYQDYYICNKYLFGDVLFKRDYIHKILNSTVVAIKDNKIEKWDYDEDCTAEWNFGEIKEILDELVDRVNELSKD